MLISLPNHFGRISQGLAAVLAAVLVLFCSTAQAQLDLNDINPFGDDPAADATEADLSGEAGETQQTAEDVFNQGKALADEGKCAEAIEYFSRILSQAPNYVPAALERGKCLAEIGESQLALESLGMAVNYGQRFPEIYAESLAERGKVFLELGNYQEAVDDFSMAVQSAPTAPEFLYLRGKALNRLARTPSSAYAASGPAEFFMQAIASLDRAIELQEGYTEAYVERGDAQNAIGEYDKSVEDLTLAAELDPENSQIKAKLGFAQIRRGDSEQAKHDADQAKFTTDYQEAIAAFSAYLAAEGDRKPEDFEDEDPEFVLPDQIFLARSVAQISLANERGGDQRTLYEAAADDAERAYEFNDTSVAAIYQKGLAQRMLGNLEAAADTFTDALEVNPGFTEAQLRRGIVYYYLGELESARGDFQRVRELTELPDGRAEFWTGVTYAKQGDFQNAILMYSKAIRLNPGYKPAFSNRGLVYMQIGEYERAARDFDELLRRNRHDRVARQRRDRARQMIK